MTSHGACGSVQRNVPPRLAHMSLHAQARIVHIWLRHDGNAGHQILAAFRAGYDEGWKARGNICSGTGRVPVLPNVLLACPFCGAQPWDDSDRVARRVGCLTKNCAMEGFAVAPDKWNKRKTPNNQGQR